MRIDDSKLIYFQGNIFFLLISIYCLLSNKLVVRITRK
jgi:hypothetical protein